MSSPKKPRRGRPTLAANGKAPRRIQLTADPAEAKTWDAAADREGLTLNAWLRAAAELAIARGSTR